LREYSACRVRLAAKGAAWDTSEVYQAEEVVKESGGPQDQTSGAKNRPGSSTIPKAPRTSALVRPMFTSDVRKERRKVV